MKVPDILLSGNHAEIKSWRRRKSFERTFERRSDLISNEIYRNSKRIIKESNQFIKFLKGNECDTYPDW